MGTGEHSIFGEWQLAGLKVGHGKQQEIHLNKARNQEFTFHCAVNHWRILIRKVTLPEPRVEKIALTTRQKRHRQGDPLRQEPGKQTQGYLVVKVGEAG